MKEDREEILTQYNNWQNQNSKFQIYLHSNEVEHFNLPNVKETSSLFRNETPIFTLIDKTEKELSDTLFNFAKEQQSVIDAVNVSIEQKMQSMTDEQLKAIFAKIKEMSSPLWAINTGGYLDHAQELTTVFTIGVYDQSKGILKDKYLDEFTLGTIKPTFATTHENDRITFFQSQCYSPAYAVNNMIGYLKEADDKFKSESYPVCYLDEKWNQRMIVEGFDIMPKQEKDRVLPNWVNAIVYGFIKFDEEKRHIILSQIKVISYLAVSWILGKEETLPSISSNSADLTKKWKAVCSR